MGEAKRRAERMLPADEAGLDLTHKLVSDGKLIEGGFAAYVLASKLDVTDPRLPALHDAFWAGAEHLWSSIMATLDPEREPTDADMRRMELIQTEVDAWRARKMAALAQSMPTKGSA